jgi:hypothetical protein
VCSATGKSILLLLPEFDICRPHYFQSIGEWKAISLIDGFECYRDFATTTLGTLGVLRYDVTDQ